MIQKGVEKCFFLLKISTVFIKQKTVSKQKNVLIMFVSPDKKKGSLYFVYTNCVNKR